MKLIDVAKNAKHLGKNLVNKFVNYTYRKFLPSDPVSNDLFLVEFPKSGITWLSFLIGNIILLKSGDGRKMTFYNSHQIIPDIHTSKDIAMNPTSFPGFRIIKSHSAFNTLYNFVILLVRNPFDVMVSYYKFCTQLGLYNGTINNFVRHKSYGVNAWKYHLESWLANIRADQSLILVRYEDLKKDTFAEVSNVVRILGLNVDETIIREAIRLSSFDEMKNDEINYTKSNPSYKLNFVWKGEINNFQSVLDDDTIMFIYNNTQELLAKVYPNFNIYELRKNNT